ncbi:MAG TPA: FadR/GntR family transcriptional regulator [Acidimicrobiales bacterium]
MGVHMEAAAPAQPNGRVSSSVVEHVRELVASGQLAPGDRLPAERDLAERLGVGRNSIREALRELQMLGLVEARRGSGTFVRAAEPSAIMAPFQTVISLSAAAVDDVMAFRRMFEPEVAAMAAMHINGDRMAMLANALRRFDEAIESEGHPVDADVDFHEVVAQCTGNAVVIAIQHALAQLFADMRKRLSSSTYRSGNRVARGHQALFGAIVAGDAEAARDVMREHLDEVEKSLEVWQKVAGPFNPDGSLVEDGDGAEGDTGEGRDSAALEATDGGGRREDPG